MPVFPNPHNNFKALNLTFKIHSKGFFLLFVLVIKTTKGTITLPSRAVTKIVSLATTHHRPICIQHSLLFV